MVINTNLSATSSARLLSESSSMLANSLARLSSGSKLVNPEDDVAGTAVALKFDAKIHRNDAANSNVGNALSFNQTRDGYLQKVQKALDRMSELAVLAQDTTKSSADLGLYDKEFEKLSQVITKIGNKTFNDGVALFAAADGTKDMLVTADDNTDTLTLKAIDITGTGTKYTAVAGAAADNTGRAAVTDATKAKDALSKVQDAITQLSTDRAEIGSSNSQLKFTSEQLTVLNDNLKASNSRIKDVDVATESTNYARYNILVQAGTAMLAQANASTQSALRLLQSVR